MMVWLEYGGQSRKRKKVVEKLKLGNGRMN
jgi:hypothetical protein